MSSKYLMQTYALSDLTFENGQGSWLFTKEGESYLDFASGIAVNSVGHCHPHMVSEIQKQASRLIHTSNLYNIEQQERLAKRLCDASFASSVFFANSGAEANEGAVKVARRYMHSIGKSEKNIIVCIEGCFHGRTLAMLAATYKEENRIGFGPLPSGFRHIPLNDVNALKNSLEGDVAAIMIEPIQGEGGVRSASKIFLEEIQGLSEEIECLVISDEVQTGMGRMGTLFGYQQTELKPDIMALAKGLGGGVPVGAVLASKKVSSAMTRGSHGSTFGGNPLVMSAANAVLDILMEPDFMKILAKKMEYLLDGLNVIQSNYPKFISDIRGKGFLIGIKLFPPVNEVQEQLKKLKVLFVPAAENVLRILPPLTVEYDEIDIALEALNHVAKLDKVDK